MSGRPGRLIHLNGASGVGKSTVARRYADDHPGTLVLDLDVLVGLVGGWRRDFSAALETARDHGRAMARRHLGTGHDVVLPQLVTVHDDGPDPCLEETASAAGAAYVEVALLVDDDEHARRLRGRTAVGDVQEHVQRALADPAADLVHRIRGHLRAHLDDRPAAIRVDTTGCSPEETYRRVLRALG